MANGSTIEDMDSQAASPTENDPCRKAREAAIRAAKELDQAATKTKGFRATKPLDPDTLKRAPLTPGDVERMDEAYAQERLAFERYKAAMSAWYECQDQHDLVERDGE
jgi:hypothetical protein